MACFVGNLAVVPRRKDTGTSPPVRELSCCGKQLETLEIEDEEVEEAWWMVHEGLLGA